MSEFNRGKAVLCYVDGNRCWFTTAPLAEQWGDDWDDAPYEHNAELPYAWHEKSGQPRYWLFYVCFMGGWEAPERHYAGNNSPWSVGDINRGAIAWLIPNKWAWPPNDNIRPIAAGTTYEDFVTAIEAGGGVVFEPRDWSKVVQ